MSTADLVTVAAVVIVPALFLWAIYLYRSGRPGKPAIILGIPQALRPGQPDETLEGPRLERIQIWGLLSVLALAIFIPAYWLGEFKRQSHFESRFSQESLDRGQLIFSIAPPLPQGSDPQAFKKVERAISLGMGCASCHGAAPGPTVAPQDVAGGGLVPGGFTPPGEKKKVQYAAPPLQNVFTRWDDEVVQFTIERGRPGTPMPAWGVDYGGPMTEQMIADVMTFLHSLPGNQKPPEGVPARCDNPTAAMKSCGGVIFQARCAVCHGADGQGKEATGTQTDPWHQGLALWKGDVRHLSRQQHFQTIFNGRRFAFMPAFAESPSQGIPAPPYPLKNKQIKAVMAYERSL